MPSTTALAEISQRIQAAQDRAQPLGSLRERYPDFDLAAGYMVADMVHRRRCEQGWTPIGRKIGFTNPAMWASYGVHEPIWGYVYANTVVYCGDRLAVCRLARYCEPKIEPEIVLHLRTPPTGATIEEVLASADWFACAFEVVHSHFPGWRFSAAEAVADGALHGGLYVGTPQPITALGSNPTAALETFRLSLYRDDIEVEVGHGSNVLGSPLRALAHLVDLLPDGSALLRPGDLISTGTLTAARTVCVGEKWHYRVEGLVAPRLTLSFAD
jgi:2-oxo-3-hexenedioate decarboxylase